MSFQLGYMPWNKGKTGVKTNKKGSVPWNKNKVGVQVAWSKGTKGRVKPNSGSFKKGYRHTEKFKKDMSERVKKMWENGLYEIKYGEESKHWSGDKVSYRGLHNWIVKQKGKANHCTKCNLDKIPKGMKRYFQWANISRKYKRDLNDWMQLCVKCHMQYDKKYNQFIL